MRLVSFALLTTLTSTTATIGLVPATCSAAEEIVAPESIYGTVTLTSNVQPDGSIHGSLKNTGTTRVLDVRLLIHHSWLWKNEMHPGAPEDNPGRSEYYVVDGEVPPGGEKRFRYVPSPPLPTRNDGHFVTRAAIVGLTELQL